MGQAAFESAIFTEAGEARTDMTERRSIHPSALPNYEQAEIPRSKLEGYALNPDHEKGKHKATLFKEVLGFEQHQWGALARSILEELPFHEARMRGEGEWGKKYVVILPITGLNGGTAEVQTAWMIRSGTDYPSLVTTRVLPRRH